MGLSHIALYIWDGTPALWNSTNSTELTIKQCSWIRACPFTVIWLQPSRMTVIPHLSTTRKAAQGLWTRKFPSVCTDHLQSPWTRDGISLTFWETEAAHSVSPRCFSPSSLHADHSSEVVTVGGVLGGVCVIVLSVWMCGWGSEFQRKRCFCKSCKKFQQHCLQYVSQRPCVLLVLLIQFHRLT